MRSGRKWEVPSKISGRLDWYEVDSQKWWEVGVAPQTGGRWEIGPQNRWEVETPSTPPSLLQTCYGSSQGELPTYYSQPLNLQTPPWELPMPPMGNILVVPNELSNIFPSAVISLPPQQTASICEHLLTDYPISQHTAAFALPRE